GVHRKGRRSLEERRIVDAHLRVHGKGTLRPGPGYEFGWSDRLDSACFPSVKEGAFFSAVDRSGRQGEDEAPMKPVAGASKGRSQGKRPRPARSKKNRIHPVIIYPFKQPDDYVDLEALYQLVARLADDRVHCARPMTVIDRKTHYGNQAQARFGAFREKTVAR